MGSKRFKNRMCVYCSEHASITGDHLFAREFFVPSCRSDLAKVPACDACNNEKSKLEHYLTTVFPFGGRHHYAKENLVSLVPDRLEKNQRLARDLSTGMGRTLRIENEAIRPSMTIPIDHRKVTALFAYIARGLAWLHFGIYLLPEHTSHAIFLSRAGEKFFSKLFAMKAAERIKHNVGRGTVTYQGVQAISPRELTIWRLKFYGGVMLAGDSSTLGVISTEIGAVTGPSNLVAMLAE